MVSSLSLNAADLARRGREKTGAPGPKTGAEKPERFEIQEEWGNFENSGHRNTDQDFRIIFGKKSHRVKKAVCCGGGRKSSPNAPRGPSITVRWGVR